MKKDVIKKVYCSKAKRDFHRARTRLPVKFRLLRCGESAPGGSSPLSVSKAVTCDLGAGGISIFTKKRLPKGSYVELDFILKPEERPIKALTRVVQEKKVTKDSTVLYKVGLQFLAMQDKNAKKVAEFMSCYIKKG